MTEVRGLLLSPATAALDRVTGDAALGVQFATRALEARERVLGAKDRWDLGKGFYRGT